MDFKIPEMPELTFDSEKHYYRLNGKYIPAVSTIMKPLSADLYKDIDEAVLKAAAERGTAVHEMIENYIKFGWTEPNPQYQGYFNAFLSWYTKYSPKPIASEIRAYHPLYHYAGTSDLLADIGGKLTNIDFKTTATLHDHLVRIQVEAYDRSLSEHGVPVEQGGAVQLMRDGTYKFLLFDTGNTEAWTVFSSLLTVCGYIQKNKTWGKK